jgi:hypothetical protein
VGDHGPLPRVVDAKDGRNSFSVVCVPVWERPQPTDPTRPATNLKKSWQRLKKKVNLSYRLHDTRHTVATAICRRGRPGSQTTLFDGARRRKRHQALHPFAGGGLPCPSGTSPGTEANFIGSPTSFPTSRPSRTDAADSLIGCILLIFNSLVWSGRGDLNARPPAPKAGALPGCATPRH